MSVGFFFFLQGWGWCQPLTSLDRLSFYLLSYFGAILDRLHLWEMEEFVGVFLRSFAFSSAPSAVLHVCGCQLGVHLLQSISSIFPRSCGAFR